MFRTICLIAFLAVVAATTITKEDAAHPKFSEIIAIVNNVRQIENISLFNQYSCMYVYVLCGDSLWSAIMTAQPKAIPASGQTVISDV